jgi:large subunit ribosomal protein L17
MFRNLSANLLKHDSIMTTLARAKELKKIAEKMVTVAKKGGMYAYKKFGAYLYDKGAARTAYHELPVRFAERTGYETSFLLDLH